MEKLLSWYTELKNAILNNKTEEIIDIMQQMIQLCTMKSVPRKHAIDPELYQLGFIDRELALYILEHLDCISRSYSSGNIRLCVDSIDRVASQLQESINIIKYGMVAHDP